MDIILQKMNINNIDDMFIKIDEEFQNMTNDFNEHFEQIYGFEYLIASKLIKKYIKGNYFQYFKIDELTDEQRDIIQNEFKLDLEYISKQYLKFISHENNSNMKNSNQLNDNSLIFKNIYSINFSFWDSNFGRMPIWILADNELKNNLDVGWGLYLNKTRDLLKKNIYTLNELISRAKNIPQRYFVIMNSEEKNNSNVEYLILNLYEKGIFCKDLIRNNETFINNLYPNNFLKGNHKKSLYYTNLYFKDYWYEIAHHKKAKFSYYIIQNLSDILPSHESKPLFIVGITSEENFNDFNAINIDTLFLLFKYILIKILTYNLSRRLQFEKNKSIKYALRSGISAIMSRNMSHNIGSHVLNYLSNPEELDDLWVI